MRNADLRNQEPDSRTIKKERKHCPYSGKQRPSSGEDKKGVFSAVLMIRSDD